MCECACCSVMDQVVSPSSCPVFSEYAPGSNVTLTRLLNMSLNMNEMYGIATNTVLSQTMCQLLLRIFKSRRKMHMCTCSKHRLISGESFCTFTEWLKCLLFSLRKQHTKNAPQCDEWIRFRQAKRVVIEEKHSDSGRKDRGGENEKERVKGWMREKNRNRNSLYL